MSRKTTVCLCFCELQPHYPTAHVLLQRMLLGMASTAVGIQLLWQLCLPAVIHSIEIFPFAFLVPHNLHSRVTFSLLVSVSLFWKLLQGIFRLIFSPSLPAFPPQSHHYVASGSSCSCFAFCAAETKENPPSVGLVSGQVCLI